ncbi:MAG: hypothetical protein QOI63_144 [Thermoplasmata archaeon]|jgi:hypothetical protein|nr:hypothetical protein [Thermoplasmata archaeon]
MKAVLVVSLMLVAGCLATPSHTDPVLPSPTASSWQDAKLASINRMPDKADLMLIQVRSLADGRITFAGTVDANWTGPEAFNSATPVTATTFHGQPIFEVVDFLLYRGENSTSAVVYSSTIVCGDGGEYYAFSHIQAGPVNQSQEYSVGRRNGGSGACRAGVGSQGLQVDTKAGEDFTLVVVATNHTGRLAQRTVSVNIDGAAKFSWRALAVPTWLTFQEDGPGSGSTLEGGAPASSVVVRQGFSGTYHTKGMTLLQFYPIFGSNQGQADYGYTPPGGPPVHAQESSGIGTCVSGCTDRAGPFLAIGPAGDWSADLTSSTCMSQDSSLCKSVFLIFDLGTREQVAS